MSGTTATAPAAQKVESEKPLTGQASDSPTPPAGANQYFWQDKRVIWLAVATVIGLTLWFMPLLPGGLTRAGQHALAVVLFTVILWVSGAVPTGIGSLLMIGIVLSFMTRSPGTATDGTALPPDLAATDFMKFWSQDTIWFIIVCFIFAGIVEESGLSKRLALYVFSIKKLVLVDLALLLLNVILSVAGMNASFPKLTLLFPLLMSIAAMSAMSNDGPYVKHIALMINILANTSGALVYSGFVMNPALGPLAGFTINYTQWLQWYFVPALVYNMACFAVVFLLFKPPRGSKGFDIEFAKKQRAELGRLSGQEIKAIVWLVIAISIWATGSLSHISTGFAAVLVGSCVLLPGIGMMNFKQFVQKTDWNSVFMLMGILAIGALGSTGFASWIWNHILPKSLPGGPMVSMTVISFLTEVLHVPLGSVGTSQALIVPSLAQAAGNFGVTPVCISFVAYLSIVGQFFFVYQNAALVVGAAYKLWTPKDILKYGAVMFFVTPVVVGVVLYPWYVYMGWIIR